MIAASGVPATVLRLPGIYGQGGPSHLGMNVAISDGRSGRPVTLRGSGRGKRNYLSVTQVATVCEFAVHSGPLGTTYAAGQVLSLLDQLSTISDYFDVPLLQEDGDSESDSIVECDERIAPILEPFPEALAAELRATRW